MTAAFATFLTHCSRCSKEFRTSGFQGYLQTPETKQSWLHLPKLCKKCQQDLREHVTTFLKL